MSDSSLQTRADIEKLKTDAALFYCGCHGPALIRQLLEYVDYLEKKLSPPLKGCPECSAPYLMCELGYALDARLMGGQYSREVCKCGWKSEPKV
jgi:hypothetical protein